MKVRVPVSFRTIPALAAAWSVAAQPYFSYALPAGGVVTGGTAGIVAGASRLDINQATQNAVIDWHGFDIGAGEHVQFNQPSASAIALNRVGGNTLQIHGSLGANGQVWLINPNGVVFGQGAQVNVGGLLATTANITNDRFMNGDYRFDTAGNPQGYIHNHGAITVGDTGLAALVAPEVVNSGVIRAKLGKVQLASGETFALDLYGDGLISLAASNAVSQQLVEHSGQIVADGGDVYLTAATAGDVAGSLINVKGLVQANAIGMKNGRIVIYAKGSNKTNKQGNSTTLVSGTLLAQGGGGIDVLGDHVGILSGAMMDASGASGGGKIRIGGDYYGQGETPTAKKVIVQGNTRILANALDHGDGGRVTVWADDTTWFAGDIEARGGLNGGNGGFVETSGKNILTSIGNVDASSTWGQAGVWLLDPNDITIQTAGSDTNVSGNPNFVTTNDAAIVTTGSIQTALNAGTSVTITTGTAGTNAQNGDITVANDITKSAGGAATLTLVAHRDINFSANANVTSTLGALNVVLNADSDGNGGRIAMASGSSIESLGGNITLGGGANPTTTAAIGRSGAIVGIDLNNALINAGGGNISMRGTGFAGTTNAFGISVYGGSDILTSGSGTINLYGTGGSGTTGNRGISVAGAGTTIGSGNGALALYGTGQGSSTTNYGVYFETGAIVTQSGSGSVLLEGTPGGTELLGVYLNQSSSTNTILTRGGDVTERTSGRISHTNAHIASANATPFNIVINTDTNSSGGGRIGLTSSNLHSSGGNITLGGGPDPTVGYAEGSSGSVEGVYFRSSVVNAAGGNILVRGRGYAGTTGNYGIYIYNFSGGPTDTTISTTGSGTISMYGIGGNGTDNNYGINFTNISPRVNTVSAQNGAITLVGTGQGSGNNNYGIHFNVDASGRGVLETTGTGAISLTGTGAGAAQDIYCNNCTIGGVSANGNITLNANTLNFAGTHIIRTAQNVWFNPRTAGTTIGIGGAAGTLQITSGILSSITAGSITVGRTDGTGAITANAATWTANTTLQTSTGGININGAQTMNANTFFARTHGASDITIGASGSITSSAAGTAITLVSGRHFINNNGAGALVAGSGRWLVYSTNPANDTIGGLANAFRRFSCTYGGSCPTLGAGNGLLYSYTPTLTVTPNALAALAYGDAANLSGYAYTLSGYLGSDSSADNVTGSLTGTSTYSQGSDIGTYNLNYGSGSLSSAMGYGFSYANNATAITVNPYVLSVTADSVSKLFGAPEPALTYTYGALRGGDDASVFTGALTRAAGEDVGAYAISQGTLSAGANYTISFTGADFLIGEVNLAPAVENTFNNNQYEEPLTPEFELLKEGVVALMQGDDVLHSPHFKALLLYCRSSKECWSI